MINAAAETHVDKSIKSPNEFINTNILGTFNLIKIANKIKNKKFKFIQVSTDEVFGDLKKVKRSSTIYQITIQAHLIQHQKLQLI